MSAITGLKDEILALARSFSGWLVECNATLTLQLKSAELLKECLTQLDIDQCVRELEQQQNFLIKTQPWYDLCWSYWFRLGYEKKGGEQRLSAWLDENRAEWETHPETRALLNEWEKFRALLASIQELNTLNQNLVEQVSDDNRRKLQALMEFAGRGNIYNAEGTSHTVDSKSAAANPQAVGAGRLLGKG